jgi:hypothetical protein
MLENFEKEAARRFHSVGTDVVNQLKNDHGASYIAKLRSQMDQVDPTSPATLAF